MRPEALVDLHCDTLTAAPAWADTLDRPRAALSLSTLPEGVRWAQFFAVFIPDPIRGRAAAAWFEAYRSSFDRQMEKFSGRVSRCRGAADIRRAWDEGKTAALLTVENGSVLAGDLDRVEVLREAGVAAVTLTWNGANELGSGIKTDQGLTDFGREAVRALEEAGILADVSHLNDAGLRDLLETARRPFLATHSNARAVCGHRRNLIDGAIREMAARRCLIGLNYYKEFLRDGGEGAGLEDLFRHAAHFLDLGAGECLALGSDFDGADLPACLDTPSKAAEAYGYFISRGMGREEADRIFFRNALDFLARNLP